MNTVVEQKLDAFFAQFPLVDFKKGDSIINATDAIENIYYLKEGFVKQSSLTEDGENITQHIFKPISYFPIMLALNKTKNYYQFEALHDLQVRKAPVEAVITLLHQEPDVLFDLTSRFAQGLSKLLQKNEQMLFKDAYTKVSALIVYMARRFGEQRNQQLFVTMSLTHSDMASWLGLQRETVSRQIEKLQKKGYVSYTKNFLVVHDLTKLESISSGV